MKDPYAKNTLTVYSKFINNVGIINMTNAIEDAIGVRIKELPITPEKILNALKEKKKQEELI